MRRNSYSASSDSGFTHPLSSEITSPAVYLQRRDWLKQLAAGAAGASLAAWAARDAWAQTPAARPGKLAPLVGGASRISGANTMEKITPYADASSYNNYYEFGTAKDEPAVHAKLFKPVPWTVSIEGQVRKNKTINIDDILKLAPLEERIYRMRCVEGWSMVIPWVGFPLAQLIKWAEPTANAKYVEFVSLADSQQMPGTNLPILDWPYVEGLRMDEAMNPLTIMAVGLYGESLPNQNGAPMRLVVPWKYGFKGAKAIVKIRFTEKMPVTTWMKAGPSEYGFYANVNPEVDHPRWSQLTERRIGESLLSPRLKTQMFNGYQKEVAHLYQGMDLNKNF